MPDHIFEGIASISFLVQLDYFGASPAQISNIQMRKLELSPEEEDDREIENILTPSQCQISPQSGVRPGQPVFVQCNLRQWPPASMNVSSAYDRLEEEDFLNFPLQFVIDYQKEDEFTGQIITKSQRVCNDINVVLDRRLPPDAIPEDLLEDSVEALDETIEAIDSILRPLQTLNLVTFGTCLGTQLLSFVETTEEVLACNPIPLPGRTGITDDERAMIEAILRGCSEEGMGSACLTDYMTGITAPTGDVANAASAQAILGGLKTKLGTTEGADLLACADAMYDRIENNEFADYVCMRVMCPRVPTGAQYVQEINGGNPLFAATSACNQISGPYIGSDRVGVKENEEFVFNTDEGCGVEYEREWGPGCLAIDVVEESNELVSGENSDGESSVTSFWDNINFCANSEDSNENQKDFFATDDNTFVRSDHEDGYYQLGNDQRRGSLTSAGRVDNQAQYVTPINQIGGTTANGQPVSYSSTYTSIVDPQGTDSAFATQVAPFGSVFFSQYVQTVDGQLVSVPQANVYSGTSQSQRELVYRSEEAVSVTIRNGQRTETRLFTPYVVAQNSDGTPTQYVLVDGQGRLYPYSGSELNVAEGIETQPFRPPSICRDTGSGSLANNDPRNSAQGNTGYKVCGPNDAPVRGPSDLEQQQLQQVLIDPTSSFLNSIRCVCLPAIEGFLVTIRNILTMIKECFEAILLSGEFDAGMCRAILTQFVCDWIFEAIQCFVGAVGGPSGEGLDSTDGIQRGFGAMSQAGNAVKERAMAKYGGSNSFDALITQQKLINSVCLAAFGADWVPDIQAAISAEGGGFQINSTGMIGVASRRFMNFDPYDGRAEFVYHTGFNLFAGAKVQWRMELICSNDNSCNHPDQPSGSCDCSWGNTRTQAVGQSAQFGQGQPVTFGPQNGYTRQVSTNYPPYAVGGGFLESGDFIPKDQQEQYTRVKQPVRYDKARLVWYRTEGQDAGVRKEVVVDIDNKGSAPVGICSFQPQLLKFSCGQITENLYGDIFFATEEGLTPDKQLYNPGDNFRFYADITIIHPDETPVDERIPKFAKIQLMDPNGNTVNENGVVSVREFSVIESAALEQGGRILLPSAGAYKIPENAIWQSNFGASTPQFVLGASFIEDDEGRRYAFRASDVTGSVYGREALLFAKVNWNTRQCQYVITTPGQTVRSVADFSRQQSTNTAEYKGTCSVTFNNNNNPSRISIDPKNGISDRLHININSNVDRDGDEFIIGVPFSQRSSGYCNANQQEVEFKLRVSLHDAYIEDQSVDPLYGNYDEPSPFIFSYNGQEQVKEVPVRVKCPDPTQNDQSGLIYTALPYEQIQANSYTFYQSPGERNGQFIYWAVANNDPNRQKILDEIGVSSPYTNTIAPSQTVRVARWENYQGNTEGSVSQNDFDQNQLYIAFEMQRPPSNPLLNSQYHRIFVNPQKSDQRNIAINKNSQGVISLAASLRREGYSEVTGSAFQSIVDDDTQKVFWAVSRNEWASTDLTLSFAYDIPATRTKLPLSFEYFNYHLFINTEKQDKYIIMPNWAPITLRGNQINMFGNIRSNVETILKENGYRDQGWLTDITSHSSATSLNFPSATTQGQVITILNNAGIDFTIIDPMDLFPSYSMENGETVTNSQGTVNVNQIQWSATHNENGLYFEGILNNNGNQIRNQRYFIPAGVNRNMLVRHLIGSIVLLKQVEIDNDILSSSNLGTLQRLDRSGMRLQSLSIGQSQTPAAVSVDLSSFEVINEGLSSANPERYIYYVNGMASENQFLKVDKDISSLNRVKTILVAQGYTEYRDVIGLQFDPAFSDRFTSVLTSNDPDDVMFRIGASTFKKVWLKGQPTGNVNWFVSNPSDYTYYLKEFDDSDLFVSNFDHRYYRVSKSFPTISTDGLKQEGFSEYEANQLKDYLPFILYYTAELGLEYDAACVDCILRAIDANGEPLYDRND